MKRRLVFLALGAALFLFADQVSFFSQDDSPKNKKKYVIGKADERRLKGILADVCGDCHRFSRLVAAADIAPYSKIPLDTGSVDDAAIRERIEKNGYMLSAADRKKLLWYIRNLE